MDAKVAYLLMPLNISCTLVVSSLRIYILTELSINNASYQVLSRALASLEAPTMSPSVSRIFATTYSWSALFRSPSRLLPVSETTSKASMRIPTARMDLWTSIMLSLLSGMAPKTGRTTGSLRIHGVPLGVTTATSRCSAVLTCAVSLTATHIPLMLSIFPSRSSSNDDDIVFV